MDVDNKYLLDVYNNVVNVVSCPRAAIFEFRS